jgi:hypothetical protein
MAISMAVHASGQKVLAFLVVLLSIALNWSQHLNMSSNLSQFEYMRSSSFYRYLWNKRVGGLSASWYSISWIVKYSGGNLRLRKGMCMVQYFWKIEEWEYSWNCDKKRRLYLYETWGYVYNISNSLYTLEWRVVLNVLSDITLSEGG